MASPARLVGIGVFVLGGLFLFTVGLFMIGDRQMAFAKKFTVNTEFKKITGLQPGGIVRVSGAKAGAITRIVPPNLPGGRFRVEFEVTEELHPLVRMDSIAAIETEGLVGGSFLGIGSGSAAAPPAVSGATIPSKEPFEIADLMKQMSDTVQKVNDTFDEMKGDVERAVASGADTIDNANKLLKGVSGDVKAMAANGARLSADAAQIAETVRKGEGSLGKLVNDDELYVRAAGVAKQAEEIAASARLVVDQAKAALVGFQAKDGPVEGMAQGLKQTMDDARKAMSAFAENMEALKHNFLLRGFFKDRGFFNLADISPGAYRQGALTKGGLRAACAARLDRGGRSIRAVTRHAGDRAPDRERQGASRRIDRRLSRPHRGRRPDRRGLRAARRQTGAVPAIADARLARARLSDRQLRPHAADDRRDGARAGLGRQPRQETLGRRRPRDLRGEEIARVSAMEQVFAQFSRTSNTAV